MEHSFTPRYLFTLSTLTLLCTSKLWAFSCDSESLSERPYLKTIRVAVSSSECIEYSYKKRDKKIYLSAKNRYSKLGDEWILLSRRLWAPETKPTSETKFSPTTKLIQSQTFFDYEGFDQLRFTYEYSETLQEQSADKIAPRAFVAFDSKNNLVREYKPSTPVALIAKTPDVPRIAVMDSGFDLHHVALNPYLGPSSCQLNGEQPGDLPFEPIRVSEGKRPPFSHGTFTASIALRALPKASFCGFSGDPRRYELRKIKDIIDIERIQLVNMSFYLPNNSTGGPPSRGRSSGPTRKQPSLKAQELSELIAATPKTLWVVAAGNGAMNFGMGANIDEPGHEFFPPSFPHDNLLVVGALDTDRIEIDKLQNYLMSDFSNWGSESVDLLAPGRLIMGAVMGGGQESWSGTSFAAPYVVNLLAKLLIINPDLTANELKQIVMETAYVPQDPFPVKTGGLINPEAAMSRARRVH